MKTNLITILTFLLVSLHVAAKGEGQSNSCYFEDGYTVYQGNGYYYSCYGTGGSTSSDGNDVDYGASQCYQAYIYVDGVQTKVSCGVISVPPKE